MQRMLGILLSDPRAADCDGVAGITMNDGRRRPGSRPGLFFYVGEDLSLVNFPPNWDEISTKTGTLCTESLTCT